MSKIYINQGVEVTITMTTDDMTGAVSGIINYRKPNGGVGTWTGVLSSSVATLGYSASSGEIDEPGYWRLQPVISYTTGNQIPGETVLMNISERFT